MSGGSYHVEAAETGCDRDSSDIGDRTQRPVGGFSPRRASQGFSPRRASQHGNAEPDHSSASPRLQEGDLVRLRSGGPEMTVKSVRGNWVIAIWWNEAFGGFQSAGFPVAMVDGPITLPPVNVRPQTSPTDRSDHPPGGATPGGPTEGSDHPPGDLSSAGQPNQNPTVQSINQTRQVRPVNATTLGSPSTRPARILPSQQGAGPLQQGTDTNQTIGVPQVRPALALPLQQGTALNQTVLPLQQGTSANQTIGIPQ